ncbi:hypothetical protein LAV79_15295 [Peribacillus butanolivorans]|uniref:hypothetical protein n=1 Tax=Peribacillus butanolivorans TaxID=421767 RepID=UPI0030C8F818
MLRLFLYLFYNKISLLTLYERFFFIKSSMQICVGEDEIDLDMDDLNIAQTAVDSGLAIVNRVIIIGYDDSQVKIWR